MLITSNLRKNEVVISVILVAVIPNLIVDDLPTVASTTTLPIT